MELTMLPVLAVIACVFVQPETDGWWQLDRALEEGHADIGGLATSFLEPTADMRQPTGWEHVYRLEGADRSYFARRHGGLTAVFPHSDYVATRDGSVPTVPAGAVYVIGEPAPWLLRELGLDDGYDELAPRGRIDLSLAATDEQGPAPREADAPSDTVLWTAVELARRDASMWYNDGVRVRRVSALLSEASRVD